MTAPDEPPLVLPPVTRSQSRYIAETIRVALQRLARWSYECRESLGLSQDQAGKGARLSQGGVSRIESGRCVAIPLVSYLALARYYRALGVLQQITITDPATLLALPEQVGVVTLDPIRRELLALLTAATPRQQRLLLDLARVVLRQD
jgi:transcriptional regulator with XRE-family HTH domain